MKELPVIIQDTREPSLDAGDFAEALFRPALLVKDQRVELAVERRKLDVGDYSLPGLEGMVAFERKTVGDLLSTLFGTDTNALGEAAPNLERFRAELERLRAYPFARIVIEGTPRDVYLEAQRPGRRFGPSAALSIVQAIDVDYRIPALWAGNRAGAELLVGFALARIWDQHTGGEAWRKAEARGYAATIPWGPPEELARYRGEAPLEQPAITAPVKATRTRRKAVREVREAVESLATGTPREPWRYGR